MSTNYQKIRDNSDISGNLDYFRWNDRNSDFLMFPAPKKSVHFHPPNDTLSVIPLPNLRKRLNGLNNFSATAFAPFNPDVIVFQVLRPPRIIFSSVK